MTGIWNRRRKIPLRPIYLALRGLNAQSLPGLHSFSGADIIGKGADIIGIVAGKRKGFF